MIDKKYVKSRKVYKVTFELEPDFQDGDLRLGDADAIYLHMNAHGWKPMELSQKKDGKWQIVVDDLEPGQDYQFRYRARHGDHDHYFNDPNADGQVANEHGSENAVLSCPAQ